MENSCNDKTNLYMYASLIMKCQQLQMNLLNSAIKIVSYLQKDSVL